LSAGAAQSAIDPDGNDYRFGFWWSMIFSDLPSPGEASNETTNRCLGFAQAANRFPLFRIVL
jgi:hypothetical protein